MACCTKNSKDTEIVFAKIPNLKDYENKGIALTTVQNKLYAFAHIKTKKGSQIYGDVANFGEVATHSFLVDYYDELKNINSTYYIIANQKLYRIKEIININEANLELNFICILLRNTVL